VQSSVEAEAVIRWMGDSHGRLKEFPKETRQNLGKALRDVQIGKDPPDSRTVPGLGRTGVFELRDQDERAWYRVIYLKKIRNTIYVLHCFEKETNQIDQKNVRTIKARLGQMETVEREAQRDEKRRARFSRS
jgi:phage-related protein